MLPSTVCRYEHCETDWYVKWARLMFGANYPVNRKMWEWSAIAQALSERGMLQPGRRGIGFAVGTEPLASLFASQGAAIIATDKPGDGGDWSASSQHAGERSDLFKAGLVSEQEFRRLVEFVPADMTALSGLESGQFDFLWSSCALEHLGTLERGATFVRDAMRLLKPGGVAVHTTEYNCSSNNATVTHGDNVIYRRRDLRRLEGQLRMMRCGLESMDFDIGTHQHDLDYDEPPYFQPGRPHIKLLLDGFVCTSALLIVRKG